MVVVDVDVGGVVLNVIALVDGKLCFFIGFQIITNNNNTAYLSNTGAITYDSSGNAEPYKPTTGLSTNKICCGLVVVAVLLLVLLLLLFLFLYLSWRLSLCSKQCLATILLLPCSEK